jgi:hypothetical protein
MGALRTIDHLSQFGQPLYVSLICTRKVAQFFTRWRAQLPELNEGETIQLAALKLLNAQTFNAKDIDHVFAVLSQRLCLDPVLAASEAVKLADRSVANHMRLLTGISTKGDIFYTFSPSEPILALASCKILRDSPDPECLNNVLQTLSSDLCRAGLVEKGLLGELGARTLLLIARDAAAPVSEGVQNMLEPVKLVAFLEKLFGSTNWKLMEHFRGINDAFDGAHVNFTHWMVTKDALPEEPAP